ncbi:MAG: alpha/beta fold hydrolase [Phycisphaerales bacterium]|nr:MAG: alpha/beta fold hydrolase [Phycisphaerales bacterium]
MQTDTWTIPGADDKPIAGFTDRPDAPRAVAVIAHGFLGYADYGMFPRLARELASRGLVAHRFNFSHSGIEGDPSSFARPDLFERDTWKKQVDDLLAIVRAARSGDLGTGDERLPLVLIGHSRGGVSSLLASAEISRVGEPPAGVVTLASPARCAGPASLREHLERGYREVVSNRTGQTLRIGAAWAREQAEDPAWHDLPSRIAQIACPVLAIHGELDETVSPENAAAIAGAAKDGRAVIVPGANHVFNTPNPDDAEKPASEEFTAMLGELAGFVDRIC